MSITGATPLRSELFKEKKEITNKTSDDLDELSDVELVRVLAKEAQKLLEYHDRGELEGKSEAE